MVCFSFGGVIDTPLIKCILVDKFQGVKILRIICMYTKG
jgi:hypothetical protein